MANSGEIGSEIMEFSGGNLPISWLWFSCSRNGDVTFSHIPFIIVNGRLAVDFCGNSRSVISINSFVYSIILMSPYICVIYLIVDFDVRCDDHRSSHNNFLFLLVLLDVSPIIVEKIINFYFYFLRIVPSRWVTTMTHKLLLRIRVQNL